MIAFVENYMTFFICIPGGQLFSWGSNQFGQLGIGRKSPKETKPQVVSSLLGCPIVQISAGGYHSFALTVSGTIFSWGKNRYNVDYQNTLFPNYMYGFFNKLLVYRQLNSI